MRSSSPMGAPSSRPSPRHTEPLIELAPAVLIDGSALFLAARSIQEDRSLDYRALVQILLECVQSLEPPRPDRGGSPWVMWTSASPQNPGQTKFLHFAERELNWEVRSFAPADSFMVEPSTILGISADPRSAGRLVRFDASIAFAAGRLADRHRLIIVSDSFALSDTLARTVSIAGPLNRPILAFFGSALDARWQRLLRRKQEPLEFIDLDLYENRLFGSAPTSTPPPSMTRSDKFIF